MENREKPLLKALPRSVIIETEHGVFLFQPKKEKLERLAEKTAFAVELINSAISAGRKVRNVLQMFTEK